MREWFAAPFLFSQEWDMKDLSSMQADLSLSLSLLIYSLKYAIINS
jgi:hypothetical protein